MQNAHMLMLNFNAILPVHKTYAPFLSRNIHTNNLQSTFKSSNGESRRSRFTKLCTICSSM